MQNDILGVGDSAESQPRLGFGASRIRPPLCQDAREIRSIKGPLRRALGAVSAEHLRVETSERPNENATPSASGAPQVIPARSALGSLTKKIRSAIGAAQASTHFTEGQSLHRVVLLQEWSYFGECPRSPRGQSRSYFLIPESGIAASSAKENGTPVPFLPLRSVAMKLPNRLS